MDQSEPGDLRCRETDLQTGHEIEEMVAGAAQPVADPDACQLPPSHQREIIPSPVQVCFVCGGDTIPLVVQFAHAGHERFHSSGFVQGIELGCERSQMDIRSQRWFGGQIEGRKDVVQLSCAIARIVVPVPDEGKFVKRQRE